MLKRSIILITIAFILAGCADDQYSIERRYWQLQKQSEKIYKNPHASPPKELERIIQSLEKFIAKYPKNTLAIDAEFSIARLYILKEEYDKARAQARKILDKFAKNEMICTEAIFLTGNSYELQNKWDSALGQYKKIISDYSTTPRGLEMPIYIAQHYKVKYEPDKMVNALREAITHYQAMSAKYPKTPLAYQVDMLKTQCYLELKEWQNAVITLESIIRDYQDKIPMDGALMNIAMIAQKELKDTAKAKEALNELIKKYPRSRLVQAATALLKEIK